MFEIGKKYKNNAYRNTEVECIGIDGAFGWVKPVGATASSAFTVGFTNNWIEIIPERWIVIYKSEGANTLHCSYTVYPSREAAEESWTSISKINGKGYDLEYIKLP